MPLSVPRPAWARYLNTAFYTLAVAAPLAGVAANLLPEVDTALLYLSWVFLAGAVLAIVLIGLVRLMAADARPAPRPDAPDSAAAPAAAAPRGPERPT